MEVKDKDQGIDLAHDQIRLEIVKLDYKISSLMESLEMKFEIMMGMEKRIALLEQDLDFVRIIRKYKFFIFMIALGMFYTIKMFDIEKLLTWIF